MRGSFVAAKASISTKKNVSDEVTEHKISSLDEFIKAIKAGYKEWDTGTFPWFRGDHAIEDTLLVPKLFRNKHD